jgi:sulfate adenylyltransferase subunit 1
MGRRVFWGRVATGTVQPGTPVQVFPSGQTATVAQVLDHARRPRDIAAGHSAGIVLDREVDVSRGDWINAAPTLVASRTALPPEGAPPGLGRPGAAAASATAPLSGPDDDFDTPAPMPAWPASRELSTTIAWMDDEPLVAGRVYWALHGHRWVKAKIKRIVHRLDVNTLQEHDATQLEPNAIGLCGTAAAGAAARRAVCPLPCARIVDPGGHRHAQDLGRRASELTKIKQPFAGHGYAAGPARQLPIKSRVFTEIRRGRLRGSPIHLHPT